MERLPSRLSQKFRKFTTDFRSVQLTPFRIEKSREESSLDDLEALHHLPALPFPASADSSSTASSSCFEATLPVYCLADTHSHSKRLICTPEVLEDNFPREAEILFFSGDLCEKSRYRKFQSRERRLEEVRREFGSFDSFVSRLLDAGKIQRAIVIAGNHDIVRTFGKPEVDRLLPHCTYLEDTGCEIECDLVVRERHYRVAIEVWGSPYYYSPSGSQDSFAVTNHTTLGERWERLVPPSTHVLLTHMPPLDIMDLSSTGRGPWCHLCDGAPSAQTRTFSRVHPYHTHWGCRSLRDHCERLAETASLRLHVFGHVHDDYGVMLHRECGLAYVNAACPGGGRIGRVPVFLNLPIHLVLQGE